MALSSARSFAPVAPPAKDNSDLITVAAGGGGALTAHLAINSGIDHFVGTVVNKESLAENVDTTADELKGLVPSIDDIDKTFNTVIDETAKAFKAGSEDLAKQAKVVGRVYLRQAHGNKVGVAIAASAAVAATAAHFIQKNNAGQ